MLARHAPILGPRYWSALCIASVFGANLGDFCARNLGLGHAGGLPILAALFALVLVAERLDRYSHQAYYWLAIIIVRTAATNLADFAAGDMKLDKAWVLAGLTLLLAVAASPCVLRAKAAHAAGTMKSALPATDVYYWASMLAAGTLGTVLGDISSFASGLGAGKSSIALSALLGAWFYFGRGRLRSLPFYWFTIVLVRTAGTAVGDYLASRGLGLGLPLSTLLTGLLFVLTLSLWKQRDVPPQPATTPTSSA